MPPQHFTPAPAPPSHAATLTCPRPRPQGIAGLAALEVLDACQNQLKRGGACALAKACADKPGLALLALDENEISEAGIDALKVGGPCFTLVLI